MERSDTKHGWKRRRRIGAHVSCENEVNAAGGDRTDILRKLVHRRQQGSDLYLSRSLGPGITAAMAWQRPGS